jgi:tRNA1(Val) A37 N6-methylase TrmN6
VQTSLDHLLAGRLTICQPVSGHRAGTDALLLAACALPHATGEIADFGAGVGTAGLALAVRAPQIASLTLVEIDQGLAQCAAENLLRNGIAGRVVALDLTVRPSLREAMGLGRAQFDLVLMNPPFHDSGRSRPSADPLRARAHAMPDTALDLWLRTAAHHLTAKGHLALIHRPDALALILQALARGFGGIRLRFVQAEAGKPAMRVLISARRGSRAPLAVLPALVLHAADGRFTAEAQAIHDGTAALPD